jgi:hypothetical protein
MTAPFSVSQFSSGALAKSASAERANYLLKDTKSLAECRFCLTGAEAKTENAGHVTLDSERSEWVRRCRSKDRALYRLYSAARPSPE